MTGNLLLQNAPPFGIKLGPFRGQRVHFQAKGAKRDETKFGISFLLTNYYDSKENTDQHTRTNTSDIFRFKCTFGPRQGPKEAKTAEQKIGERPVLFLNTCGGLTVQRGRSRTAELSRDAT